MTERNVNIRLQVLDGGKTKAELQSVGAAGAAALDALQQKSQQAAASVNKLRSHEVGNLAAQLSDIGVSLASGQSPFTVLIQQGAQISQIMGDRGLKGILAGVGQGILGLLNPTTALLAGLVAVGYAGSYAYEAIFGKTEDASEAAQRHEALMREVSKTYGDAARAAEDFGAKSREGLQADLTADRRQQLRLFKQELEDFSTRFGNQTYNRAGAGSFAIFDRFKPFAEAIDTLREGLRAGEPDVAAFREEVARLMNASDDPAIQQAGAELRETTSAAAEAQGRFEAAGGALDLVRAGADGASVSLKALTQDFADAARNADLIGRMQQDLANVGDERAEFIARSVRGLAGGGTAEDIAKVSALADAIWRKREADRAARQSARELAAEQRRTGDALERDGQRVFEETRTAAERYAVEIERLNELLSANAIDQETYGRKALQLQDDLREAERAARDKATDLASGVTRAVEDYLETTRDVATQAADLIGDAFQGVGDLMVGLARTGKLEWKEYAASILEDLIRIGTNQVFASLIGGLFGGGGGIFAAVKHGGGVVGAGGGGREVPAALFLGAPRFHGGGGFLAADERPAILQVGERVVSRAEVAAGGRAQGPTIVQNFDFRGTDPSMKGWVTQQLERVRQESVSASVRAVAGTRSNNPGYLPR